MTNYEQQLLKEIIQLNKSLVAQLPTATYADIECLSIGNFYIYRFGQDVFKIHARDLTAYLELQKRKFKVMHDMYALSMRENISEHLRFVSFKFYTETYNEIVLVALALHQPVEAAEVLS